MSCDVCIGHDPDDGVVEELSEAQVTARKPHKCYECHRPIPTGTDYQKFVGKWEGKLVTYRTCLLCVEVRKVFTCGEGWTWGTLWEDMAELAFPQLTTATECFRELSPAAKKFVLDNWQRWKGL